MKIILPTNSTMLTRTSELRNFCSEFFYETGLTQFDYSRYYSSGESFVISTDDRFVDKHYKAGVFNTFEECEYARSMHKGRRIIPTFFNPSLSFTNQMPTSKKHIGHMLLSKTLGHSESKFYIVIYAADYYEIIGFGKPILSLEDYVMFYTGNYMRFLNWAEHFKCNFHSTLVDVDRDKIYLQCDSEVDRLLNERKTVLTRFDHEQNKITETELSLQEYRCLEQLSYGKTMKEIARTFGLSSRTIETYIHRIKHKTRTHSKSGLISMLMDSYRFSSCP